MKEFVLLFIGGEQSQPSPAAMQAEMKQWQDWLEQIRASGKLRGNQGLQPTGKAVRGRAREITDGPYAEVKDLVNGILIIEAESIEAAAEVAKGCPILNRDGVVEVRPAWPKGPA